MRATPCLLLAGFLCALVVTVPLRASAGSDALTDKAATLYDEGIAAYKKSKWAEARASFLAAWSLKKHWQIAASLGDCEAQLGLYRDAAEHVAYFLRNAPPERQTSDANKLSSLARAKIATLVISVDANGADVAVDGKVIGKAPLEDPVFVEPGHHVVEARLGANLVTAQIDAGAGASPTIKLAVAEAPARKPSLTVIVAGAGLGAAALGTGVALLAISSVRAGDASAKLMEITASHARCSSPPQAGPCSDVIALRRGVDTLHNVGVPLAITGSLAAVSTLVYAILPRSSGTGRVEVLPVAGPHLGGLWLNASF